MNDNATTKQYVGTPEGGDYDHAGSVTVNGAPLDPCFAEVNHSPTGFAWNYGGSGPAQLAYAILRDYTGSAKAAQRLYQAFKRDVIACLDRGAWTLDGDQVAAWLEANDVTWPRRFEDSSAISFVDYAAGSLVLSITFRSGVTWEYFDVTEDVAVELVKAESVGKYFHANIKGRYEGAKVEDSGSDDVCQHDNDNLGYANGLIYCLECDGVIKDNATWADFEKMTGRAS